MTKDQHVPYRRMPLGYVFAWIGANGALMAYNQINRLGWPPGNYLEFLSAVLIGGLAGGLLWGWLFWRFWLYKKFPKKNP